MSLTPNDRSPHVGQGNSGHESAGVVPGVVPEAVLPTDQISPPPLPSADGKIPNRARIKPRIWGYLFALLSFEIGLFLAVYPWMDSWNLNHFSTMNPSLQDFWDDAYFRGAISGLGLINLYVAFYQVVRLIHPRRTPSRDS